MALRMNHILKIKYTLGMFNTREKYADVLSEEQLNNLQDSVEKEFVIGNAYCRIDYCGGDKNSIEIRLGVYANETTVTPISSNTYKFTPDLEHPDNFIKQGYEYLKTLIEYKSAVDC